MSWKETILFPKKNVGYHPNKFSPTLAFGKGSMFIEVGMSLLNAPRLAYYASLFKGIFGIKYFCLITSYVLSTSIRPNSSWYCCTTKSSKLHTGEALDLMSLYLKDSASNSLFLGTSFLQLLLMFLSLADSLASWSAHCFVDFLLCWLFSGRLIKGLISSSCCLAFYLANILG